MTQTAPRRPTLIVAVIAATVALCGCATTLPSPDNRVETSALADTGGTRLGRALSANVAAHPGKSGIHPLPGPRDAFAARGVLAGAADRSIDVQYYIWHGDQVGYLLFEALWDAAGRGVRVRMLLDDANTAGLDPTIAALDAHPNIEVRLYNPFVQRGSRALGYLSDFTRLNRRMHNKSFTVDNQITVVGGRNIGNEYFGAGGGLVFADLDVAAVGPVVREVSMEFDIYWNSPSAYPAASFVGNSGAEGAAALRQRFAETRADPASVAYLDAVRHAQLARDILARRVEFEWVETQAVFDDPAKTLDATARTDVLLFPQLVKLIGKPRKSLDLISPYFVPRDDGTAALVALAGSGVQVRILTNSLAASDVSAVHAGYAKHREALLKAGVQLYELKPTAGRDAPNDRAGLGSSSSSGLHAKTFAVDRSRIFVGSFNFDPRSARLNTEMGLVIDSPTLALELASGFDTAVPRIAYEVRLAPDGRSLQWIERTAAGEKVFDTEPQAGLFKRMGVGVMSILPIEWLL
jgi:putative cardiolipin synthase